MLKKEFDLIEQFIEEYVCICVVVLTPAPILKNLLFFRIFSDVPFHSTSYAEIYDTENDYRPKRIFIHSH